MKNKLIFLSGLILIGVFVLFSISFAAELKNPLGATTDFPALLEKIIKAVGGLIATLGVIMLVWSGILFITSAGDPGKVGQAKTALFFAIAGLTIGLAAQGIVDLVKEVMTGP